MATGTLLALPSGDRARPARLLTLTVLVAGVAEIMTMAALVAGYFNMRHLAFRWPAKGAHLDNYLGTTLTITLILSTITAQWAVYALRQDNRRQALTGLAVTLGLGAAFLNLLTYVGTQLHFGASSSAYAVMVCALLITTAVMVVGGLVFIAVAIVRTLGGQSTVRDPDLVRAAAWHWHVVGVAWLLAFVALYAFQNR
jgi:cytochrome c oxidase subunit III